MLADINAERKSSNLSSSIRLFILRYYRDRDRSEQSDERAASLVPQHSFVSVDLRAD
jgi:predicted DNA-binding ribbon-helix-helix protein